MKRVAIGLVVLVVVGAGAALWLRARAGPEANPADLQTMPVTRGTVTLTVSADGVLQPLTTVAVKSCSRCSAADG